MPIKNKRPELIAPAGDLRKLKYAFAYGADAVYCGLPAFSLRAQTGFDLKSLKQGIAYAHKLKKKVYATINIFAHNRHLKILSPHLKELKKIKPDAIVISDIGILQMVKKFLPKTPIHLSTQMNTLNYEAVKFWQKQGVKRIILGRETALEDIKEIHQRAPKMELEVFVHGAMCMSYSGRCYLSAWLASLESSRSGLNQRSANQGLCTQPCRWEYKVFLEEPLRPGEMIPLEADKEGTYIMNSKDLCLIDYLDELAKAGVVAFKLEGRTKSVYYLAVVTKAYRKAINLDLTRSWAAPVACLPAGNPPRVATAGIRISSLLPVAMRPLSSRRGEGVILKEIKNELYKIDNRGYTTGFLLGDENMARHNFKTSKAISDWGFVGEVIKTQKHESKKARKQKSTKTQKQDIFIRVHNVLKVGEKVELVTPDNCYTIEIKELFNRKGEKIKEAHGGTREVYNFMLSGDLIVSTMSILRSRKF